MIAKTPISASRIRKVPPGFGWVDHRLVRDRHIERCSHAAAALYLFLITVGDGQGLSYYGDRSIRQRLDMTDDVLRVARDNLISAGLIAWRAPLYQVLSLQPTRVVRDGDIGPISLGDIMEKAMGGRP